MRTLLLIGLLLFSLATLAQRTYYYGFVKDSTTNLPMSDVHVQNANTGTGSFTDETGSFKISAQNGDSLLISSVSYYSLVHRINTSPGSSLSFTLSRSNTLLDEVVVNDLPDYKRFKELILEAEPQDSSLQLFGVEPVVVTGDKRLEEKHVKSIGMAVSHPIDFIYQNLSKREKEKRKMYKIDKKRHQTRTASFQFTREWVGDMVELEGDKLTSFIDYCDFSDEYLASTSEYMVYEKMKELLPAFLAEYERG